MNQKENFYFYHMCRISERAIMLGARVSRLDTLRGRTADRRAGDHRPLTATRLFQQELRPVLVRRNPVVDVLLFPEEGERELLQNVKDWNNPFRILTCISTKLVI